MRLEDLQPIEDDAEKNNFNKSPLADSGARRAFKSGAVRDISEGKGRFDLIADSPMRDFFTWELTREDDIHLTYERLLPLGCMARSVRDIYRALANPFYEPAELHSAAEALLVAMERLSQVPTDKVFSYAFPNAFMRLAKHYENGALKYSDRNWEKGIPTHCFIDSGIRHIFKAVRGDQDEDHLAAAVWNIFGCIWTMEHHPEMNDIPNWRKNEGDKTVNVGEVDDE